MTPTVVTAGPSAGWAVWPSGRSWLVLQTSDGFTHVANRTPVGVSTEGGLVGTFDAMTEAVAVGAHEKLYDSPVMTAAGSGSWVASELPGAVAQDRDAVSVRPGGAGAATVTVVSASGNLLEQAGTGWETATGTAGLFGTNVHLDSVRWASSSVGWLTGHGRAGVPKVLQTIDGGVSWQPLAVNAVDGVAALAPCGSGSDWVLPTIAADGSVVVLRTTNAGTSWAPGDPLKVPAGQPAWGCSGSQIWMAGRAGAADDVFSSPDFGAHWTDGGRAPAGLSDLAPTGGGSGFAASAGDHATLWRVTGDGARFTQIPLPTWVLTLGGDMSDNS
jgi:hypothetical protein